MTLKTFFGVRRTDLKASGAEVWEPTYDPEALELSSAEFLPCENWTEGLTQLQTRFQAPNFDDAPDAFCRVFAAKNGAKAVVLPHPMLRSLHNPSGRGAQTHDKFVAILKDPRSAGKLYLPDPKTVGRLLGVGSYYSYDQPFNPSVTEGQGYSDTTAAAFSRKIMEDEEFYRGSVVFGRVELSSAHNTITARLDPDAYRKRLKASATRAKTEARKQAEAVVQMKEQSEKQERQLQLTRAVEALEDAGQSLWAATDALRGYNLDRIYVPGNKAERHWAVQFLRDVRLHERLNGKGKWRTSKAVLDALDALYHVQALIGTKIDPLFGQSLLTLPAVRTALKWLRAEIARRRRVKRRLELKAARRRPKAKPQPTQPAKA